jgi:citrate synthase
MGTTSYRGFDILEIAETCSFEEVAHLLVHARFPNRAELAAYSAKLKALRVLPGPVRAALEAIPAAAHPMDVMRTGVSALGCTLPEPHDHNAPAARDIADRMMASLGSIAAVLVALGPERQAHRGRDRRRQHRRALPAPAARQARAGKLGAGDAHIPGPLRGA